MRRADVFMQDVKAGILEEIEKGKKYTFTYHDGYTGRPISLTLPTKKKKYEFDTFPSFFDGLLPEGMLLEGLLRLFQSTDGGRRRYGGRGNGAGDKVNRCPISYELTQGTYSESGIKY
jgi:serine/threonine-protein kinase HipA